MNNITRYPKLLRCSIDKMQRMKIHKIEKQVANFISNMTASRKSLISIDTITRINVPYKYS